MMLAARNAFLMSGGSVSRLGSVLFYGTAHSYLYHSFTDNNPDIYTVTIWAKTAAATTHGSLVKLGRVNRSTGYPGSGLAVGFGNTSFDNNGTKIVTLSESVVWGVGPSVSDLDAWAHYALTVNGRQLLVYRNGTQIFSWTPSRVNSAPWTMYIGGYNDSVVPVNRQLACNATRCAMWSRVLSASEIVADCNAASGTPDTNGLTHYWPLSTPDDYLIDRVGSAALTAATDGVEVSTDSPFN